MDSGLRLKVLLIEDDKPTCEEFVDYFDGLEEFQISGVTDSGIEALEMLKKEPVSVVIVDLSLREGDGLILIDNIVSGKHLSYLPYILVITNIESVPIRESLFSKGVNNLFGKEEEDFGAQSVAEWLIEIYEDLPHFGVSGA